MTVILTTVLLVFVVSLLGIMYFFQVNMMEDFYVSSVYSNLENIVTTTQRRLPDVTLENVDYYDYQYIVDEVGNSTTLENACIMIEPDSQIIDEYGVDDHYVTQQADDEGNLTGCSLTFLSSEQKDIIREETKASGGRASFEINRLAGIGTVGYGTDTLNLKAVAHTVDMPEGEYLVVASYTVDNLATVTDTIQSQFAFIFAIVIVFVIILALIFSLIFVKPLKKINEEAKTLPDGIYEGDEIKTRVSEMVDINSTLIDSCEAIKQADVARKELLSNISHDLRTPLTMIVGYGEMMIDFDDEKTNDNIKLVVDEAKRLSYLVNDLLDLSKAELGKLDMHKEKVDLNSFLTSVYDHYHIYLENQHIEFILDLDDSIECELDDARMRQVLYNFINNAMNYNDKDEPKITLMSKKEGDEVTVSVLDNGQGIAKEDIEKIWDRYYKVDKEHKRQLVGSGIGLSLAKMILEAHELEYGVESEVGEYSRFYFKIKAHAEIDQV